MDDVQPREVSEAHPVELSPGSGTGRPRHVETAPEDSSLPEAADAPAPTPAHAAPETQLDETQPAEAAPVPEEAPAAGRQVVEDTQPQDTPPVEEPRPEKAAPQLLFSARGLELAGRNSMVFGPLDLDLRADEVAVVTGQQGSGRSALLLALAGRLKGVQGSLQVGAVDGIAHPRALRQQVSIARISGLADLEPQLTVGESRDERAISEGIGTRRGREQFSRLEDLLDHRYQTDDLVDHLPAVEKTLLTLMLGCLRPAAYVVCDDVDDRLTDAQLGWIHDGIAVLREDGHHFVLSSLDQSPLPEASRVIHLQPPPSRDADFVPTHSLRRRLASLREDA